MGENTFLASAAVLWNSYPVYLKQQATERGFKFLLKQLLLKSQV